MDETLQEAWEAFAEAHFPPNVEFSYGERLNLQRAFYAGAWAVASHPFDEGLINRFRSECRRFNDRVQHEMASPIVDAPEFVGEE